MRIDDSSRGGSPISGLLSRSCTKREVHYGFNWETWEDMLAKNGATEKWKKQNAISKNSPRRQRRPSLPRENRGNFKFLSQKLYEATAATRPTTSSRAPPGNKLVLDGGREAAHVGGIHAERSVDTCEEGVGGGEGKEGELEGRGVLPKTVDTGAPGGNGQDAPIPLR